MTNAAREGARVAVLPGATQTAVTTRVKDYLLVGMTSTEVTKSPSSYKPARRSR